MDGMGKENGGCMKEKLYQDARQIMAGAIGQVMPDAAVRQALSGREYSGKVYLVAVGKAAWQMAEAAVDLIPLSLAAGIVLTKYGHVKHRLPGIVCLEAGHPVPDENSLKGTEAVLDMTADLTEEDTVLFLLSGGGSALFEQPLVSLEELQDITGQLLASGADIVEINRIRKRLSGVKGGRFAQHCAPAKVEAVILSDIVGDPLDMIASGPVTPDSSTCAQALAVVRKYGLNLSDRARAYLERETPKELGKVETRIIGNVRQLCAAAGRVCRELGYETVLLTDCLGCEAKEAGRFMADIVRCHAGSGRKLAFLAGGETVVSVTGHGMGGRNQELALAAAPGISGLHAAVFSVGSDGTDGPTDAAGGYVDGDTQRALEEKGYSVSESLADNDAYHALKAVNGLLVTGPTGTNVNDVTVALLQEC